MVNPDEWDILASQIEDRDGNEITKPVQLGVMNHMIVRKDAHGADRRLQVEKARVQLRAAHSAAGPPMSPPLA